MMWLWVKEVEAVGETPELQYVAYQAVGVRKS
jgi:hypothetical protein